MPPTRAIPSCRQTETQEPSTVVMAVGSVIYLTKVAGLRRSGVDVDALFSTLPPE